MPLVLCATATTKNQWAETPVCSRALNLWNFSQRSPRATDPASTHSICRSSISKICNFKKWKYFFIFKVSSKSVSLKAPSRVHSALNIVKAMRQTLRCWSVTKRAELGRTWSLDVRRRSWRCLTKRKSGSGETLLLSTPPWKEGVAR